MKIEQWYLNNSRPLALQALLKNETLQEVMAFLKERALPRASDLFGVTGPDRITLMAELQARYAGWHDCLRMLESLASPQNEAQSIEVLQQYSDDYVKKLMKQLGTPIREDAPEVETQPRRTRKSK